MKKMIILVAPPGAGKSTLAKKYEAEGYLRINQDLQGRMYTVMFLQAVERGDDIVCDRMNFDDNQRRPFLEQGLKHNYKIEMIVLHESYDTCFKRIMARKDHETIKDEKSARAALHTFFVKYERPRVSEYFDLKFVYPEGDKPSAIVVDLDGTLCNVEHRRHFVRREGKKDWAGFFRGIADDTVNQWCKDIAVALSIKHNVVFASGRGQELEQQTRDWLDDNIRYDLHVHNYQLYMRHQGDHRQDYVAKEIILDFEILTRFKPVFMIDDRQQVVDLWRKRGFVCLQCDLGDF